MSGFNARSKSTASLLSAVVLASAMLAPVALAAPAPAGNSFEIPLVQQHRMNRSHNSNVPRIIWSGTAKEIPLETRGTRAYYGSPQVTWGGNANEIPLETRGTMQAPRHVATNARAHRMTTEPATAARPNNNPECVGGYTWTPTPNSGVTLPMRCHG